MVYFTHIWIVRRSSLLVVERNGKYVISYHVFVIVDQHMWYVVLLMVRNGKTNYKLHVSLVRTNTTKVKPHVSGSSPSIHPACVWPGAAVLLDEMQRDAPWMWVEGSWRKWIWVNSATFKITGSCLCIIGRCNMGYCSTWSHIIVILVLVWPPHESSLNDVVDSDRTRSDNWHYWIQYCLQDSALLNPWQYCNCDL